MRTHASLFIILLFATPSWASDKIELAVDRFDMDSAMAKAVVRFTNNSPVTPRVIHAECAFLDENGKAIDVGIASTTRLTPGQVSFDNAIVHADERISSVLCRLSGAI